MSTLSASITLRPPEGRFGGALLTSSTPDALWRAPALQVLQPYAISVVELSRGALLDRCSLTVPVGMRLLVVSDPPAAASLLARILAGLVPADRGRIEIAGIAGGGGRRVAYLGPAPGIPPWMTPREAVILAARLAGLAPREIRTRVDAALADAGVTEEELNRPVARGGPPLVQRTDLAAALIAEPEVLIGDEPLMALDGNERERLLELAGPRRTLLMASRYPAAESGLVSHVALLRDGRVQLVAPTTDLAVAGESLSLRGIQTLAARGTGG